MGFLFSSYVDKELTLRMFSSLFKNILYYAY